jgi:hypothetical protein
MVATSAFRDVISADRLLISFKRSAMVGSAMAADGDGAGAADEDVAAAWAEDRVDRDTRLSRTSGPRLAGPRLRSS